MNHKATSYLVFLFFLLGNAETSSAQSPTAHEVDSFRNVIIDGFMYNEKIIIEDSFSFLKLSLYAFVNFDQTATFNDVLLCFEKGYNKEIDPPANSTKVQILSMSRDIRWVMLFYLDQFVFRAHHNQNKYHKESSISMIKLKDKKEYPIYGEDSFDNVIKLYQALIINIHKKTFKKEVLEERKASMLEFIGYDWIVNE